MIRFCTVLIFLLLVVTTAMLFATRNKIENSASSSVAEGSGTALIGGDFTLVNQDNVQVSDKDFRGKVMMVFFGFTRCPDICPTTSLTFAKVLEALGDKAGQVAPVFISVDPEHDTPAVLKEYFKNIDSRIIGLTGTPEQTKQAAAAYKAYFAKAKNASGDDTVDHSGFVYLMDKNGVYVQHFPYDVNAQEITDAVLNLLK